MPLHPETVPYASGRLDVGDGQHIYWETCGNPDGKPAVAFHGGPGSGCGPGWARYFDPDRYRVVLFDQRGCGRSTPWAGDPGTDMSVNTTQHMLGDIERLREHLGIERWLVFGGSWGSTLGLAYAQAFPARVSEMVLFSVVTTTRREVEWVTRDMGRVFPAEWARFADVVPAAERDGDLAAAYNRMLEDPDPTVRERAARAWCDWEDTHVAVTGEIEPDPRFEDPGFRYLFARMVTHYFSNAGFLPDGQLVRDAVKLNGIPGLLCTGRMDVSGPADIAWQVAQRWTDADLVIVGGAGHGAGYGGISDVVLDRLDQYAKAHG